MHTNQVLENAISAISVIEALRSVVLARATHPNEFASLEKEAHYVIQQLKILAERGHSPCN